MAFRFNLQIMFLGLTAMALFMAVVANENFWLASATLSCVFGWLAVAKILQIFGTNTSSVMSQAIEKRRPTILLATIRWSPWLVLAVFLVIVIIALTNSVRAESSGVSGGIVTMAVALVPMFWAWQFVDGRRVRTSEP